MRRVFSHDPSCRRAATKELMKGFTSLKDMKVVGRNQTELALLPLRIVLLPITMLHVCVIGASRPDANYTLTLETTTFKVQHLRQDSRY